MSNIVDIRTGRVLPPASAPRGRIVVTGSAVDVSVQVVMPRGGYAKHKYPDYEKAMHFARGCAMQNGFELLDLCGQFLPEPAGDAA